MSRATRLAALLALTLLGGWLRFASTDFGLPQFYRPDEQWVVPHAWGFEKDLNPGFGIYPAAQMYVQHAVLRAWAHLAGPRDKPWRNYYVIGGEARAYLIARRTSAAMGTATIPVVYAAANTVFGPVAGLASAAILAFSPLHVRDSKFATVDVAMTFWVAVALWLSMRIVRSGGYLDHLAAGLAGGLAAATKYPAAVAAFAIAAAHLGTRRREGRSIVRSFRDLRLFLSGYGFVVAFALAAPYFFLDWRQTRASFEYQRGAFENSSNPWQDGSGWPWLLGHAIPDGCGPEIALLFAAALLWAVFRRRTGAWVLLAFLAAGCVGLTRSATVYYRYTLPLLPALAILAGGLFADLAGRMRRAGESGARKGALVAAFALLLLPGFVRDLRSNALLAREDTRTLARAWIIEHVSKGAKVATTDLPNPTGKPSLAGTHELVNFEGVEKARQDAVEWVLTDTLPQLHYFSRGPKAEELAELERGATLEFDVDPVTPGAAEAVFDRADGFYSPLRRIRGVSRPGPRIRIWRIAPAAPAAPAAAVVPPVPAGTGAVAPPGAESPSAAGSIAPP
jgi:hypothetical protein